MRLPALSCTSFVVIVMVVSFAYLAIRLMQISMITGSVSIAPSNIELFRLRITEEGVALPYSFIFIWNPIMFVIPVIVYYLHRQWRPLRLAQFAACFCLVMLYLGFIYLSTSRSTAFVSLLVLFFVLMYGRVALCALISIPLIICVSFFGLGALVGKGEFSSFGIYLLAPLHAFDVILNQNPLQTQLLSFRPLQPILYQLGYLQNTFHLLDYIETPYPVNVYTVFGVYVHDYGVLGTSIIVIIISYITYSIHLLALYTNSARVETLSAFCLAFIVLGVFYDYYTSSMFTFLAPILIIALFPNRFGFQNLRPQST
jgi:oligosaccharide repeat unit polymerase